MDEPSQALTSSESVATLKIGEVAARADLSVRTLRHWEEMGLIEPSARTAGGFRLYTEEDLARVRLLRFMKPLKFTLEQMRELLALRETIAPQASDRESGLVWPNHFGVTDPSNAAHVADNLDHFVELAEQRLRKLDEESSQVEEFVTRLRAESHRARADSQGT